MNDDTADENERLFAVGKVILLQSLSSDQPFHIPECVLSRDYNTMVSLITENARKKRNDLLCVKQTRSAIHNSHSVHLQIHITTSLFLLPGLSGHS